MRAPSVLILALLAAVGPAPAQAPPAETARPVQAFEESIDVRVVNLEAVVTDARGRRVPGLAAQDFRLLVDGVETPITFFSRIDEKERRVSGEAAAGAGPAAEPTWQSRNILVFLDEATMVQARRDFVLTFLAKQLDDLAPGDQMAVVAFAGSRLEVLCDWTGDRARLASALAAAEERPARGIHSEVARRQAADDAKFEEEIAAALGLAELDPWVDRQLAPSAPLGSIAGPGLEKGLRATATSQEHLGVAPTQLFNPLDHFLEIAEAAAGAMRGLPAPPGRKMLMLLTEGFQNPYFARPVVQEANRLGYSLYPVDVKGIDTFHAQNDAEDSGPRPFFFVTTELDRQIDYTLQSMAAATGGRASLNSNRLAALDRLVEDSSSYYLLGFSPTWRGDDRRHSIALTVSRPGLEVRTRDSYVDASRRKRLTLEAGATLLLGRARSEPRLIVTLGKPVSVTGETAVSVSLGVPVESLAFVPREKGFHAEAPIAVVVLDDKGKRKELPGTWLEVDVAQLPLEGTYAHFEFPLAAGSRARRIIVTVHDALSGEALWGEARLEAPGQAARPF